MSDRITANLPARDFDATAAFYAELGFSVGYRDDGWMILERGPLEIEFFPHPNLSPADSWFSACVRVADIDALHAAWESAGLPASGVPRLSSPREEPWGAGFRACALIDLNGNLLRCMSSIMAEE